MCNWLIDQISTPYLGLSQFDLGVALTKDSLDLATFICRLLK